MQCINCKKELEDGSNFCNSCGTRVQTDLRCQSCNAEIHSDTNFCGNCGVKVAPAPAPVEEDKPLPKSKVQVKSVLRHLVPEKKAEAAPAPAPVEDGQPLTTQAGSQPKAEKPAAKPASILKALMDEYQLTAFSLSKAINISNSSILQILNGKGKITVATALRFQKFFGNSVDFWLDAQQEADLAEAKKDAELNEILKGISKVKKPAKK
ncbi:MAG: HigA family addiction module antitoxin [Spirochaetes bacterium]|nr:HigA family addiction module antitoxin [Spirochaetota bacterium]